MPVVCCHTVSADPEVPPLPLACVSTTPGTRKGAGLVTGVRVFDGGNHRIPQWAISAAARGPIGFRRPRAQTQGVTGGGDTRGQ